MLVHDGLRSQGKLYCSSRESGIVDRILHKSAQPTAPHCPIIAEAISGIPVQKPHVMRSIGGIVSRYRESPDSPSDWKLE